MLYLGKAGRNIKTPLKNLRTNGCEPILIELPN